ncbi:DNA-directed RNA polymerase II subunit 2,DNA-directed RNA polymerase I subunit 2,DNA-directed RNA polymerase II subunit RPB2,DNA-directed RNA polymerase II subunit rpb2,DNA-directed RNA polymerase I subunit rpa2,DNA-directed RNA polymerase subunit B,DNA-directed RNA polymerases IV and V subunit 2,DNA-directed RNA polymerase I subunit RPA2,DNA-directed RNA polymerase I subunit RPA135,DNA-directed RNA polymerase subunit 2,DNA-directed RNA polymerase III subunit rpc2,DNA-directed RNA polymerase III subunit RP|uniref:DNA-directed RNA polymerase n=1 Tax=Mytilus coruscus TaxID=42192 RepID=A0A6J8DDH9_MYTCO|nr:DNA-directed RNA polymerase II subunit 2,DNA-directed RNA polymerase I subunit 2,DNA-directed RNA polymerase II subunit RPB2,DNA-directed RNA polymerase II subunit rpb2,DNA-directed RNA polymerase I subunit rpa2,DNA-directed RNA polymerase subunit B,DNA-directed RNA polymerases IV and V subunit 2,DNA-directed RNA polymerase I subunit RPA2,DNA-directed RNA polymerase I subunit RPA135,DNA-directed RNA polymerase subunit 2,DNA-directed RNA polymerase III subunit rpc2,DNA-directed RNA polymerase III
MEVHSIHSVIERKLKTKPIYVLHNYVDIFKISRLEHPNDVNYLSHQFFKKYSDLNYYNSIRPGSKVGDNVVTDIRALMFLPEGEIKYKLTMLGDYLELPRRAKISAPRDTDQRNPIVGDKFSSRHGQKGICSMLYPVENLPFTESGMVPDIIFNPHGYPSRMTIGMMIESMAGKSAASHGHCYDATPFKYTEDQPPIDYMGKMLNAAGYNYYGTERLYSGVDGRELEADIFIGIVYYQRLRHMVSDKFQVRTTGPIDQVTHQPVKGRKRGGGIRFGEMERDALISHGSAFLLQDRLLNCSDSSLAHVCKKCGSILSPYMDRPPSANAAVSAEQERKWACSICKQTNSIELIKVPYVFKYLVAELAAINIKVNLDIQAF